MTHPNIADFNVQHDGGSLFLVTPETDAARTWLNEHISEEATWFAGSLVVEHGYIENLVAGVQYDGFTVGLIKGHGLADR